MMGYGVDYRTPRPPFVLFKLLWRYSIGIWVRPLWLVLRIFVRFFAGILGSGAGFFGHADERVGGWAAPLGSVKPGLVQGMDADEYI